MSSPYSSITRFIEDFGPPLFDDGTPSERDAAQSPELARDEFGQWELRARLPVQVRLDFGGGE